MIRTFLIDALKSLLPVPKASLTGKEWKKLPLNCLIILRWFSRASCKIISGWSIFHRHSVPTGFVWCLKEKELFGTYMEDLSPRRLWHCLITLKATRNTQQYPASDTAFRCHLWTPFSSLCPSSSPKKQEWTSQHTLNITNLFGITGKRFLS